MGDRLPNQRSGIKRTYYRRGAHYKGNFYTKISCPRLACGRENEKDVYGDQHSGVTNNRRWMDGWMEDMSGSLGKSLTCPWWSSQLIYYNLWEYVGWQ